VAIEPKGVISNLKPSYGSAYCGLPRLLRYTLSLIWEVDFSSVMDGDDPDPLSFWWMGSSSISAMDWGGPVECTGTLLEIASMIPPLATVIVAGRGVRTLNCMVVTMFFWIVSFCQAVPRASR